MDVENSGDIDMFEYDAEEIEETLVYYETSSVEKLNCEESKLDIKQEKNEDMQVEEHHIDDDDSDGSDDEETIATFLTASGQRLALYAVEDSDEVFAVAEYDESGAPPTDFQFLTKADVERLIGEGAVKTVKRPRQKVEALNNEELSSNNMHNEIKNTAKEATPEKKFIATTDKKVNYTPEKLVQNLIKTENSPVKVCYSQNLNEYIGIDPGDEAGECEEEIIEQSTVQYILCGEQSDSELTFDDIQALQSFKNTRKSPIFKPKIEKKIIEKPPAIANIKPSIQNTPTVFDNHIIFTSPIKLGDKNIKNSPKVNQYHLKVTPRVLQSSVKTHVTPTYRTYVNTKKNPIKSNVHVKNSVPNVVIKKEVEDYTDYLTDETDYTFNESSVKDDSNVQISSDGSSPVKKIKRSRKQKLTTVNRGDSEIIIQPVSAFSDEEENEPVTPKRKGRRKKKTTKDPDYSPRTPTKKLRKSVKNSVEVIDLDIDESEKKTSSKNVLEITIDDNKEKDSSDKENDVISVMESDEENEQNKDSPLALECDHCFKLFRLRKALEKHLKACPKLPAILKKDTEEKKRSNSQSTNKEYPCKVCGEIFDLPLLLANHVRRSHKKIRSKKDSFSKDNRSLTPEVETDSENEDKSDKKDGKTNKEEKKNNSNAPVSPESKRRGRPKKIKKTEENYEVTPSKKSKSETSDDENAKTKDDTLDNEQMSDQRKKGKPFKKRLSVSDQSAKNDNKDFEEKKKGRPIKKRISMDDNYDSQITENESHNLNKEKSQDVTVRQVENKDRLKENTIDDISATVGEKNKLLENEQDLNNDRNNKTLHQNEKSKNLTEVCKDIDVEKDKEQIKNKEKEVDNEEKESNGEDTDKDEKDPKHSWKVKKLNCATCNEWFSSAEALNAHNNLEHKNDQTDLQRCPVCKELIEPCNYTEHSKTHRDDTQTDKSEVKEKSDFSDKEKPELIRRRSQRIRTAV